MVERYGLVRPSRFSTAARRFQRLIDRLDALIARPDAEEEKKLLGEIRAFVQEVPVPEWPEQPVQ